MVNRRVRDRPSNLFCVTKRELYNQRYNKIIGTWGDVGCQANILEWFGRVSGDVNNIPQQSEAS